MIITKMRGTSQRGFTIAEVSIASTIFAVVLLIALAVFFGISRLFYKGVSQNQTQEAAQQIMQDVIGSFQPNTNVSANQTGNNYTYHCIGNTRFTYHLNSKINTDNAPNHASGGSFGILMDTLPGNGNSCAPPCSDTDINICQFPNVPLGRYSPVVELLGNNMRVSRFDIQPASNKLYNVTLIIAYGDDDLMDLTDPTNPVCKNQRGSEFCAVNKITTSVFQGMTI